MNNSELDPFAVLELPRDADADLIRKTYLEAVKQYPPDKDAEKFRAISNAYKMLQDPLVQAQAILRSQRSKPVVDTMLQQAAQQPVRLQMRTLLALGNASQETARVGNTATGSAHGS